MKKSYFSRVILLLLMLSTSINYAQLLPTDDLRDLQLGCNSNNYTIFEVFLSGSPTDSSVPVAPCDVGPPADTVVAYVWARYTSNSNSTVYAFTIFSDLILNHQDGTSDSTFTNIV